MTSAARAPLAAGPEELVAVTRPLAEPPDLLGIGSAPGAVLWTSEQVSLAGTGTALRLEYPGGGRLGPDRRAAPAVEALAAIEHDDGVGTSGSGPVALGALPFHPDAPGTLVVPERVVGCCGDRAWETVISRRASPRDEGTPPRAGHPGTSPDEFRLVPSMPHAAWREVVAETIEQIRGGGLVKVVLARRVDVAANRPFLLPEVIARLAALYPTCMVFHLGGFIGASPELLVRRSGRSVACQPLAGTVARSGDREADEALVAGLLASTKDRAEHRVVIDHLAEVLNPWCESLAVPETPAVIGLRNVSHLATRIEGRLAARDGRPPSALELVAAIHPTAAVGGWPPAGALRYLEKVEGFDRGPYAGPVGWVDGRGDGAFALGIRSALVEGSRASMYAGVGVVADSDPDAELTESQLKLQALLAALVRP